MTERLDSERRAILRWFDSEAKKYERSDYAAWCVYFYRQIATGEYKDKAYWSETGQTPNGKASRKTPYLPSQIITNKV